MSACLCPLCGVSYENRAILEFHLFLSHYDIFRPTEHGQGVCCPCGARLHHPDMLGRHLCAQTDIQEHLALHVFQRAARED